MGQYIAGRLGSGLLTLVFITLIVFLTVRLLPGDAVLASFEDAGVPASLELKAAVRKNLGLDKPVVVQYLIWSGNALRGDLGTSFGTKQRVSTIMRQAVPVTLELTVLAVIVSGLIAFPLGIAGALDRGGPIDHAGRLIAVFGITVPSFVLGMGALLIGVRWFHWVPPARYWPLLENPRSNLTQFALAALILGYGMAAGMTRIVRSSMLEILQQDFVRTARAKGLRAAAVTRRHVLRNALISPLTLMGVQVAAVLGGAVVIETIFNLPGLGFQLVASVQKRNYPVIQAGVLFTATAVLLVNIAVDVCYVYLDPRLRHRG